MKVSRFSGSALVPKSVSVGYELQTLEHAVEGALVLVELQRVSGLEEGEDIGRSVSPVLALVACRVRDLGRVVRGSMPADQFLAPHNDALDPHAGDDPDLLVPPRTRAARSASG